MGDLNADFSYFNENSPSLLRGSAYNWIINNSVDTKTKSTDCTYDKIISNLNIPASPVKSVFAGVGNYVGAGFVFCTLLFL
jgi:hypothetical protein